ncbi:hypothetical protein BLNAU_17299 [Blattamonas nauphoetae]|uniref:Uncharacterized protein n=1 Tax=Blattamonas nauphoetae TaxID=2049346 RepID=A0ABQ9X902_9EUKA|nr:hypothetical protein BLNAU_17299 [Blattamonas nauphoetae]
MAQHEHTLPPEALHYVSTIWVHYTRLQLALNKASIIFTLIYFIVIASLSTHWHFLGRSDTSSVFEASYHILCSHFLYITQTIIPPLSIQGGSPPLLHRSLIDCTIIPLLFLKSIQPPIHTYLSHPDVHPTAASSSFQPSNRLHGQLPLNIDIKITITIVRPGSSAGQMNFKRGTTEAQMRHTLNGTRGIQTPSNPTSRERPRAPVKHTGAYRYVPTRYPSFVEEDGAPKGVKEDKNMYDWPL